METYISDAKKIWKDYKKRMKEDSAFKSLNDEDRLIFYQTNYKEFNMNFPIVIRYMAQLDQFHIKAFEKYVKKMQKHPYRSEEEYCERQADYVKYLYMELSPKYDMKIACEKQKNAAKMLKQEIKAFKEAEEIVKKKLEKNNEVNSDERRKELKKLLAEKYNE
jgi:hypothetical protein